MDEKPNPSPLTLAANVSEAEYAQLFAETQQRLSELNALFRVAQGLAENLSLDELLQLIVDEATRSVPSADKAVIHLLNGNRLEPRALSKAVEDREPSSAMRAGFGIAGRALEWRQTQYVPDTRLDSDFVDRHTGLHSLLVAPLIAGPYVT